MSINDPVVAVYNEEKEYWYLKQGRETFFDEQNNLRTWPTAYEAIGWALDNIPGFKHLWTGPQYVQDQLPGLKDVDP
jgi:hypothetical protein